MSRYGISEQKTRDLTKIGKKRHISKKSFSLILLPFSLCLNNDTVSYVSVSSESIILVIRTTTRDERMKKFRRKEVEIINVEYSGSNK